jgi:hypothetical protein
MSGWRVLEITIPQVLVYCIREDFVGRGFTSEVIAAEAKNNQTRPCRDRSRK